MAFSASIELGGLDGTTGFRLTGTAAGDQSGYSVASAGDVNGDGYDDLIVGAFAADPNGSYSGASYVVFGKASGFGASLDLSALDGTTGFRLTGAAALDQSGFSVASAGDVNGDGYDDLIVGANGADPNGSTSGASYVVFGKASGFATSLDLSTLDGTTGFRLNGAAVADQSGRSVASAGDVNGDGYDDLIVGANGADPNGSASGASYVVFGQASGFSASLELSTLDGTSGFRLNGAAAGDQSGFSVASAGDVNGDGYDDLIVGAPWASPNGSISGASYVVFGQESGFSASLELSTLDGTTGFRLNGVAAYDLSGRSVASAGDVNGDGYDDLIVGAPWASPNGPGSGASYVVFGKASGFAASLDLSTLDGATGFLLSGAAAYDQSGYSVASAGDVNGDGVDDLIVGAWQASPSSTASGASYVVFGMASAITGGPGADSLVGTADDDTLVGEGGNDTLDGAAGADTMTGGTGNDTYHVDDEGDALVELAGGGIDKVFTTLASYTLGDRVERVEFTGSGDFTGYGNAVSNRLTGGTGDDSLYGRAGSDTLDGGAGADLMTGGTGNDMYYVDDEGDAVVEVAGGGIDKVNTTLSSYTLLGSSLDDLTFIEHLTFIGTGDFTGTGNAVGNRLTGGAGDDTLGGEAGNDTLDGGAGADLMTGGTGNDTYHVDDEGDAVVELAGGGIDKVFTTLASYTLGDRVERVEFTGTGDFTGTGNDVGNHLTGGAGNDVLYGEAGNDTLNGGAGADLMTGGTGDDIYYVDDAGDSVVEVAGGGIDKVFTTLASYTLGDRVERVEFTGTGDFTGTGNAVGNHLIGGAGNDVLVGGRGADTLTGGTGADVFVFREAADSTHAARDTITDFTVGQDRIDFTEMSTSFHALQTVTSAPTTIKAHSMVAFAGSSGDTVLYVNDTGTAQSTSHASMEILLKGVTTLGDADLDYFLI